YPSGTPTPCSPRGSATGAEGAHPPRVRANRVKRPTTHPAPCRRAAVRLRVDRRALSRVLDRLRYAPILNQRLRRELRRPNRSWRVDETYVRVAGRWTYLYRAVDSAGETIDFMLSPYRDLTAAKLFLRSALSGSGGVRPRVINVDGHPAYVRAI